MWRGVTAWRQVVCFNYTTVLTAAASQVHRKSTVCAFRLPLPQKKVLNIVPSDLDPIYKPHFDSQGFYEWKVTVARKPIVAIIRPEDLEDFAAFDTSLVWDKFPDATHVLTIHGMKDATVPPWVPSSTSLCMSVALGLPLP